MLVPCPNCGHQCEQNGPPVRGPVTDGSEIWICLKCPAMVCSYPKGSTTCYIDHTATAHPEMHQPHKRPTEGGKKNKQHKK